MTDTNDLITNLKDEADALGVKYSPNIGAATLQERIDEKKAELEGELPSEAPVATVSTKKANRMELVRKARKLIRVKVTNMNPNKKSIKAEYFSFGNAAVGDITRLVPFDTVTHVEEVLLNVIRNRRFAKVTMEKNSEGKQYPKRTSVQEFNIETLPPLTEKELKDLAVDQSQRGAIDRN